MHNPAPAFKHPRVFTDRWKDLAEEFFSGLKENERPLPRFVKIFDSARKPKETLVPASTSSGATSANRPFTISCYRLSKTRPILPRILLAPFSASFSSFTE